MKIGICRESEKGDYTRRGNGRKREMHERWTEGRERK
jgi:hypothetical protein